MTPPPIMLTRQNSPFRSPTITTQISSHERSPNMKIPAVKVEDWRLQAEFLRENKSSNTDDKEKIPQFHLREITKHGANPATKDYRGFSPLYYCVLNNNLRALQALLDLAGPSADLHQKFGVQKKTLLHVAAQYADKEVIHELMVKRECNPDILDAHGRSPLFYSILRNALPAVLLFLQYGANLHFVDVFHKDVLEYSLTKRYVDIMRALLRAGIKLGKNEIRGKRLLFNSCKTGDFETAAILIERGLSLSNIDPQSGNTPLQTALEGGDVEFFVKLVKFANSEDVNLVDKDGTTLLTRAIAQGIPALVEPLLNIEGVSINRKDKSGLTPLMIAARQGSLQIVELLLANKPLHQEIDNRGNTALFHAIMRDKIETVVLLLKHGASVYHRNFNRKLPIDQAKSPQCRGIIKRVMGRTSSIEVSRNDPPLAKSRSFVSKELPSLRNIPRRPRAASQNITFSMLSAMKRKSSKKLSEELSPTERVLQRIQEQERLNTEGLFTFSSSKRKQKVHQTQDDRRQRKFQKITPILAKLKFQQHGAIPLAKTYDTKHDKLIFTEDPSLSSSRLNWEVLEEEDEDEQKTAITERNQLRGVKSTILKRKWREIIEE